MYKTEQTFIILLNKFNCIDDECFTKINIIKVFFDIKSINLFLFHDSVNLGALRKEIFLNMSFMFSWLNDTGRIIDRIRLSLEMIHHSIISWSLQSNFKVNDVLFLLSLRLIRVRGALGLSLFSAWAFCFNTLVWFWIFKSAIICCRFAIVASFFFNSSFRAVELFLIAL